MQALASRRGLGTCGKLCSVVSAMSCALHLLMFCFSYLCNITIPKRRETLSLFPHGTRDITGPRYPLRPWNDFDPRNTGCTCDRLFLGTHRCLELAYPLAFGEQLFPGRERCGTFRPLPSRPSGPVFQLKRRNLTFLRLRSSAGTLLSPRPSASRHHAWLAPDASCLPDARAEREDAATIPSRARLLGMHCI